MNDLIGFQRLLARVYLLQLIEVCLIFVTGLVSPWGFNFWSFACLIELEQVSEHSMVCYHLN